MKCPNNKMEFLQDNVDKLYAFRDHFFENNPIEEAKNKPARVKEKLDECLSSFEDNKDTDSSPDVKAQVLYLRGRAHNILPDHSTEAERLLSRAVKLNPALVEAWNELGECYWKRGDVETASTCFEGALRHRENKESLRSLSIVMRQKTALTVEERHRNIENGLTRARKAVQLDTRDGISWSILGNAYFAHFFSISQNPHTLKQAMSAYKQAEKDVIAKSTPELHYNKGIALKYEEDYPGALDCFSRAKALDPTWPDPEAQQKNLVRFLSDVQSLIELKGKLKTKRLNSLIQGIDPTTGLGPYGGGKFACRGTSVNLQQVNFCDLQEGINQEKVVLGKVICSVHSENTVPFTFCIVDTQGKAIAVNLYNLAPGKGVIIGDTVAIPEPFFTAVRINHMEKSFEFDLVRVESPLVLVINGKKAPRDLQAGIELSTFTVAS